MQTRSVPLFVIGLTSIMVTAYALVVYGLLPLGIALHPVMRSTFKSHATAVYLHIFASSAALALGPFQFSARLRTERIGLHRFFGRLYLGVGVLVGGLAGLFMASHAFGGPTVRLGFGCLALAWLYSGLRAYLAVRSLDFALHRQWMIRNFALTFAAVTLRVGLAIFLATGIEFRTAYSWVAWLCWIPNLIVAELWIKLPQRLDDSLR